MILPLEVLTCLAGPNLRATCFMLMPGLGASIRLNTFAFLPIESTSAFADMVIAGTAKAIAVVSNRVFVFIVRSLVTWFLVSLRMNKKLAVTFRGLLTIYYFQCLQG